MHNKGDAVDVKDCATILASVNAPGTSTEESVEIVRR
jgi:hypothetical protein